MSVNVNIPESLRKRAESLAESDGVSLDQFIATEALLDEIGSKPHLRVLEQLGELSFDGKGNLPELL